MAETLIAEALSLRYTVIIGSSLALKKSGFLSLRARLMRALTASSLTLHFGSSRHCLRLIYRELIMSGPMTSMSLAAAWMPPFLTSWLSSFIISLMRG